jgi:hypothetical protein
VRSVLLSLAIVAGLSSCATAQFPNLPRGSVEAYWENAELYMVNEFKIPVIVMLDCPTDWGSNGPVWALLQRDNGGVLGRVIFNNPVYQGTAGGRNHWMITGNAYLPMNAVDRAFPAAGGMTGLTFASNMLVRVNTHWRKGFFWAAQYYELILITPRMAGPLTIIMSPTTGNVVDVRIGD